MGWPLGRVWKGALTRKAFVASSGLAPSSSALGALRPPNPQRIFEDRKRSWDRKVEDEDAVEATFGSGDQGGTGAFVVGVGLVGG